MNNIMVVWKKLFCFNGDVLELVVYRDMLDGLWYFACGTICKARFQTKQEAMSYGWTFMHQLKLKAVDELIEIGLRVLPYDRIPVVSLN